MEELYELIKFMFVMFIGANLFTWGNIVTFIFISRFVNGDVELTIDVPKGSVSGGSKEDEQQLEEVVLNEADLPFSVDLKRPKERDGFKQKFKERIDRLKKEQDDIKDEQTNEDGSFAYDENVEMKMQDILDKLNDEIGDDLPAGIEVVTDEYEKSLERKK